MTILYILLFPVIIGYYVGSTRYFAAKTEKFFYSIDNFLSSFKYILKTKIIGLKKYILGLRELYYFKMKLPELIRKTREGDTWAIAERLKHTNHTRKSWGRDSWWGDNFRC